MVSQDWPILLAYKSRVTVALKLRIRIIFNPLIRKALASNIKLSQSVFILETR